MFINIIGFTINLISVIYCYTQGIFMSVVVLADCYRCLIGFGRQVHCIILVSLSYASIINSLLLLYMFKQTIILCKPCGCWSFVSQFSVIFSLDPEIDRVDQNDRSAAMCARLDRSTRLSPNLSTRLDSAQLGSTVIDSIDLAVTLAHPLA